MEKNEAIELMKLGVKITHRLFLSREWMTMEEDLINLEDGAELLPEEFWRYRTGSDWKDGYTVYPAAYDDPNVATRLVSHYKSVACNHTDKNGDDVRSYVSEIDRWYCKKCDQIVE